MQDKEWPTRGQIVDHYEQRARAREAEERRAAEEEAKLAAAEAAVPGSSVDPDYIPSPDPSRPSTPRRSASPWPEPPARPLTSKSNDPWRPPYNVNSNNVHFEIPRATIMDRARALEPGHYLTTEEIWSLPETHGIDSKRAGLLMKVRWLRMLQVC